MNVNHQRKYIMHLPTTLSQLTTFPLCWQVEGIVVWSYWPAVISDVDQKLKISKRATSSLRQMLGRHVYLKQDREENSLQHKYNILMYMTKRW